MFGQTSRKRRYQLWSVLSPMGHIQVWAARLIAETASRAEEDQTYREVLLDYTRLVWAQDFLAFCCRTSACGIADQSFTHSISSRRVIYTSVKSTIVKKGQKTMKALPHSLTWNFDQRQRLGGGQKRSFSFEQHSQPSIWAFTTAH